MTRLFDAKPFIIAEVGSNWRTFEHCVASIEQAKVVGADAVKFQAFSAKALYGWETEQEAFQKAQDDWRANCKPEDRAKPRAHMMPGFFKISEAELPPGWIPRLAEHAKVVGIEFMCTAFSPELVAAVDPYVEVHKVASSDLTYPQLLMAVAETGKPVLLSTGASSEGDIAMAWALLDRSGAMAGRKRSDSVVLMYCVSAYPARTVDLRVMSLLEERSHGCRVGFSDHTVDILGAPLEAVRRGAVVLEKHVTFFPGLETPDRPHSLTPDEFKTMVDYIRGTRQPTIGPTPEERAMMLRHNRRLIATCDIPQGTTLIFGENYGAYRALQDDDHGMSPFLWDHAFWGPEGMPAARDIQRGKGIGPGDFDVAAQGNE